MAGVEDGALANAAAVEVLHVTVIPPVRPGGPAVVVRRAMHGHAAVVVEVIQNGGDRHAVGAFALVSGLGVEGRP